MKKSVLFLTIFFLIVILSPAYSQSVEKPQIHYTVDVTNYEDDLFHVTIVTDGLKAENNTYNLPATAPGTYNILDFGRFVQNFSAYSRDDKQLEVNRISVNSWEIEDVEKLTRIEYKIEDTFDAEIDEHKIYPMGGSGIENHFILMNTFAILGYFDGLQSIPVKLSIDYKSDWIIGTALTTDKNGYYFAETYDHLADNPILIGELSTAQTKVNDIDIKVYVYSPDTSITAEKILLTANDVLQSAGEFIGYSPVTHYDFLFCIMDNSAYERNKILGGGALEHSYSSAYVYPLIYSKPKTLKNDMAHEFMHILTPLNLHSEIIHSFNFAVPTASEHIWLYEGVTEWCSNIMQLRSGLITPKEYLETISNNLNVNDQFNPDISLSRMSEEVYSPEIVKEFLNFYNRGAVTAALLDIRLLELSDGKYGLRELFLELLNKYGKYKPFPEEDFFDVIVDMTYPEIRQFIDDYIRDSKPMPYKEYFYKLGYKYVFEKPSDDERPTLGIDMGVNDVGELFLVGVKNQNENDGLKSGDVILKLLGEDCTLQSVRNLFGKLYKMNIGDTCDLVVRREGEEVEITQSLKHRIKKYVFEDIGQLSEAQKLLREVWIRNL